MASVAEPVLCVEVFVSGCVVGLSSGQRAPFGCLKPGTRRSPAGSSWSCDEANLAPRHHEAVSAATFP